MAILKIVRSNEHTNRLRVIKLLLNNKEIGSVSNSSIKEFPIEPGRYSLLAKIDWCSSKIIDFEVIANETIVFELMSFAKGEYPNAFSALYYLVLKPKNYLLLKRVSF